MSVKEKKKVRSLISKKVKIKMTMNSMGAERLAGLFMFVVVVLEQ